MSGVSQISPSKVSSREPSQASDKRPPSRSSIGFAPAEGGLEAVGSALGDSDAALPPPMIPRVTRSSGAKVVVGLSHGRSPSPRAALARRRGSKKRPPNPPLSLRSLAN